MKNSKSTFAIYCVFALAVIGVFVAAMFPLKQSDFYETFNKLLANPADPTVQKVVERAKALQQEDKIKYLYPSTALEAAAREIRMPSEDGSAAYSVDLVHFVKPNIVKAQKLQNNGDVISLVRKNASGAIRLGIDLNGGAEFLLHLQADKEMDSSQFDSFRDNAIETLRKRLEAQNFFETEISPAGQDFVSVRVPSVNSDDRANLEKLILRSAKLEFRLVHPNNDSEVPKFMAYLAQGGDPDSYPDTPSEAEFLAEERRDDHNNLYTDYTLVETTVQMEGDNIKDSYVTMNEFGQREILLFFNTAGTVQFGEVTGKHVGERLAIVLDGQLYSAPTLLSKIDGGTARITGSFSQDEAKSVSDALKSGSLPFVITIASRSDIDATVGQETIRKSIYSGILGTALVMIFMLIYYRLAGLVANISLLVNTGVLLGAMAAFDVTLTLPGIAGIILTLGMAVDANVLIYERIREEQDAGKSLEYAVKTGFDRAFSAIFDSNVTTLFTGAILYWQGTGAIKGFAMTLVIGIFTTMFSAVFLSRLLFEFFLMLPLKLKKINMMMFLPHPHFDFIKFRFVGFGISACLILVSLVTVFVRGRDALSIDFTGGTQLIVSYVPKDKTMAQIPATEIEKVLEKEGYDAKATYKKITDEENVDGRSVLELVVRDRGTGNVSQENADTLIRKLDEAYPDVKLTKLSESTLGALIGAAFTKSAIKALICAMIGMIIYMVIRFQFSYSIAANIALIHDVIVATGLYLLFGGQISLQVVASLLTLIGYSVNDTIVIFDRQRENLATRKGLTYFQIVDLSLNQTLARTILTSVCVMLVLICQLIFGGDGIRDFVAVILIGNVAGCYSSIFVSPMITAYWHKEERNISSEGPEDAKKDDNGEAVKA